MPAIAQRAKAMPPSPIRKLAPVAEEARRRGVRVYQLNIGQPDVPTPPALLDAYRRHQIEILAYGHSGGLWDYRESLARYYRRHGIDVDKEQVLVTTGGSEAILFALLVTCDPGDDVLIPEPFYTNYNGFAVQAGVGVVPVPCDAEHGYALPPAAEIRARLTPRTRAILICNPSNPTGYVYTWAELSTLREIALERDLFLITDEVYREFVFDGAEHHSVLHLSGVAERAILVDSISKRFSACGARIGCLVAKNQEVLDSVLRFAMARLCPPTLEQMAAMAALSLGQDYFAALRDEYRRRRDAAFEVLERLPGVVAHRPRGAFYAMVRLPVDDADRFCSWLLSDFSDEGETVMLAPGNGFYASPGLGGAEVRIAFVLNVDATRRAMEILARGLEAYPGRLPT
ncbi:MAG TPA: pyridoxal phosphate-dependent aminotransferase [Thermoanaerobaculia bacterium]|nr:pyridoxal phosphate-dependent aminotransferase [Thermoanaerobaculia bacterium]